MNRQWLTFEDDMLGEGCAAHFGLEKPVQQTTQPGTGRFYSIRISLDKINIIIQFHGIQYDVTGLQWNQLGFSDNMYGIIFAIKFFNRNPVISGVDHIIHAETVE